MPLCPHCNTTVEQPSKVWSIASELDRYGRYSEQKVALYMCTRCSTKFPIVAGSTKFRIVLDAEWLLLRKKASEQEKLLAEVQQMKAEEKILSSEIDELRQNLELERLRSKQDSLASEVTVLRKMKMGLQDELSEIQQTHRFDKSPAKRPLYRSI